MAGGRGAEHPVGGTWRSHSVGWGVKGLEGRSPPEKKIKKK